jgi:hypothetical protein
MRPAPRVRALLARTVGFTGAFRAGDFSMTTGGWIPYLGGLVFSAGFVLLALALAVGACCALYRLARYLARHFRGEWRTVLAVGCPPARRLRAAGGLLLWTASAYAAMAGCDASLRFGPLDYDMRGRYERLGRFDGVLMPAWTEDELEVAHFRDRRYQGRETVRLWGILSARSPTVRREALRFTRRFVDNSVEVHIVDIDPYGQINAAEGRRTILGQVSLKQGGHDLAVELVRRGLARWDGRHPRDAYHLRRAEEEARAAHRGMWAAVQVGEPRESGGRP